jgi:uncharacterized membrane protein
MVGMCKRLANICLNQAWQKIQNALLVVACATWLIIVRVQGQLVMSCALIQVGETAIQLLIEPQQVRLAGR